MPRQLTVLGAQAAYPTAGQPCSGFLLTWDAFNVVLDLGYGTLDRLLAHVPDAAVDVIVLTHEHPDHWLDLHGLLRQLHYGPRRAAGRKRPALFCPPGVVDKIAHLEPDADLTQAVDLHVLAGDSSHAVGPFVLEGTLLPHWVPNVGVRLSVAETGAPLLAYTGDTGPTPLLAELARGARLFIVEATDRLGEAQKAAEERNLMESSEAGFWAAKAGAERLLLTHFWPGNDRGVAVSRAKNHFTGPVMAAEPGLVVKLDDDTTED